MYTTSYHYIYYLFIDFYNVSLGNVWKLSTKWKSVPKERLSWFWESLSFIDFNKESIVTKLQMNLNRFLVGLPRDEMIFYDTINGNVFIVCFVIRLACRRKGFLKIDS